MTKNDLSLLSIASRVCICLLLLQSFMIPQFCGQGLTKKLNRLCTLNKFHFKKIKFVNYKSKILTAVLLCVLCWILATTELRLLFFKISFQPAFGTNVYSCNSLNVHLFLNIFFPWLIRDSCLYGTLEYFNIWLKEDSFTYALRVMQVVGLFWNLVFVKFVSSKELSNSEQLNHHGSTVLRDDEFKLAFIALIWQ